MAWDCRECALDCFCNFHCLLWWPSLQFHLSFVARWPNKKVNNSVDIINFLYFDIVCLFKRFILWCLVFIECSYFNTGDTMTWLFNIDLNTGIVLTILKIVIILFLHLSLWKLTLSYVLFCCVVLVNLKVSWSIWKSTRVEKVWEYNIMTLYCIKMIEIWHNCLDVKSNLLSKWLDFQFCSERFYLS